jgi:hypothetical protein
MRHNQSDQEIELQSIQNPAENNSPHSRTEQLKADRKKILVLCAMRTMEQHITIGSLTTGSIGGTVGMMIGSVVAISSFSWCSQDDHVLFFKIIMYGMLAGVAVTAALGSVIGFVSGAVKTAQVCATRDIRHPSDRVQLICGILRDLLPLLSSDSNLPTTPTAQEISFFILINQIISTYENNSGFFGKTPYSDSSRSLLKNLKSSRDAVQNANAIITYLSTDKNQGKRLFNVIMDVFEAGKRLIEFRKNRDTGLLMLALIGKRGGKPKFIYDVIGLIGEFLSIDAPSGKLTSDIYKFGLLHRVYKQHTGFFNNAAKRIFENANYETALARMACIADGETSGASYDTLMDPRIGQ